METKGDPPRYDAQEKDYNCSVCQEPWEAWSISNLQDDWTRAQVAAFKAGLGCPACLKDEELAKLGEEILAKQRHYICGGCLTAVYDEGGDQLNRDQQAQMAIDMGAEVSDHFCAEPEKCECACRRRQAPRG